jgi:MFS family permease
VIHLALLILASYIIARAIGAVFGLVLVACAGISDWLDCRFGRRKRFWWTVAVIVGSPVLLIVYAVAQ